MADKLPYEYFDLNDSFEENVIIHMNSQRKFRIVTEWETGMVKNIGISS